MTGKTRTVWLATAVALALPMGAWAAGGMGDGPMGGMRGHHGMHGCMGNHDRMDRLARKLGLTDAQKKQIQTLREETRKDMKPLFQQKRQNMRQMRMLNPDDKDYMDRVKELARKQADLTEKMIVAGAESRSKFRAILTDAQRAKLKQMRENRRKAYRDRRGMDGGY